LIILLLRKSVPESPRWLMVRGCENEAGRIVGDIEQNVSREKGDLKAPAGNQRSPCAITRRCGMYGTQ
jgi:hypothetical protein